MRNKKIFFYNCNLYFLFLFIFYFILSGCKQDKDYTEISFIKEYSVNIINPVEGIIVSEPAISRSAKIKKNSIIKFTAKPHDMNEFIVDTWTVIGGFIVDGGKKGSESVLVKITKDTTVTVVFTENLINKFFYDDLKGVGCAGGIVFKMIKIPEVIDVELGSDEFPDNQKHRVSLSAYNICETEVTQELYEKIMGTNPSHFSENPFRREKQAKRPVEKLSWFDCFAFCNELTKKLKNDVDCIYYSDKEMSKIYTQTDADNMRKVYPDWNKKGFRLPTEAEWEYAAKGGTNNRFSGINEKENLKDYAWFDINSAKRTHEVKNKKSNEYGLYDMSGNVWEWCWDVHTSATPPGGKNPKGYSFSSVQTIRGGSWLNDGYYYSAVGFRIPQSPSLKMHNVGIRFVHTE